MKRLRHLERGSAMAGKVEKDRKRVEKGSEIPSDYVYKPWPEDRLSATARDKDKGKASTKSKSDQE